MTSNPTSIASDSKQVVSRMTETDGEKICNEFEPRISMMGLIDSPVWHHFEFYFLTIGGATVPIPWQKMHLCFFNI